MSSRSSTVQRLGRSFFARHTLYVARGLIGANLVRIVDGERLSGVVVETEAYRGRRDPASHAYPGVTKRNEVMFGEPGHAYVYFIYGFHYCLNFTTEPSRSAGAVLIRALEPREGLGSMMKNRGTTEATEVASGPAKLTQALRIDLSLNGTDVVKSKELFLEKGTRPSRVLRTTRVGVTKGKSLKWRFLVEGSSFVSKGRPALPESITTSDAA